MTLTKGRMLDCLAALIEPGWFCVDVGANKGDLTQAMLVATGAAGQVVAIEPDPRSWPALDDLAMRHPTLAIQRVAAGATDGEGMLYRTSQPEKSSLFPVEPFGDTDPTAPHLSVLVRRLDSLVLFADLVKIDVQGGEHAVLMGASALLTLCQYWIVELWPTGLVRAGTTARAVLDVLRPLGFEPFSPTPDLDPITWDELDEYAAREHRGHEHINVGFRRARPLARGTVVPITVTRVA